MANTWPSSLQQSLNVDNFAVKLGDPRIRSENDVGVAKMRARYTDAVDSYSCSINLDFIQYSTLTAFYKTTLGNGTLPFQFLNPLTQTLDTFRFVDPPQIAPLGGRVYRVTMNWERLP